MSDNGDLKKEEVIPEVFIHIKLTPPDHIEVAGVIDNEILSMGMLERAKDIIKAHNLNRRIEAQPKIHKGGILGFARRR